MKRFLIFLLSGITLLSSFVFIPKHNVNAAVLNPEEIFNQWVNFPGVELGAGYNAQWQYNASNGLYTTANVGFTGYYNPTIERFTTGEISCEILNRDSDPLGLIWGLKNNGSEGNDIYSFYMYEECGHNIWSISYISAWEPKKNTGAHCGPVYHATIDASDGQYNHTGKVGSVGFASGEVLAYGTLPTDGRMGTKHKVDIKILENNVSVFINDVELSTVEANVQAGSYGPVSSSNPNAHFYSFDVQAGEGNGAISSDFDIKVNDEVSNSGKVEDKMEVVDNSKTDSPATIVNKEWVVKLDGEEIYRGETPFTDYNKKPGKYETTLTVENSQGIMSTTTKELEVKDSGKVIIIYEDENGNEIKREEVIEVVGAEITIQTPEISGYTFDKIIGKTDRFIITKEDQIVRLVYIKNKDVVAQSNDNNTKIEKPSSYVKTSDESNLTLYSIFMTISIIGLGIILKKKFVK